jgi:hypothetical protein
MPPWSLTYWAHALIPSAPGASLSENVPVWVTRLPMTYGLLLAEVLLLPDELVLDASSDELPHALTATSAKAAAASATIRFMSPPPRWSLRV